jgi:hypothetical protein
LLLRPQKASSQAQAGQQSLGGTAKTIAPRYAGSHPHPQLIALVHRSSLHSFSPTTSGSFSSVHATRDQLLCHPSIHPRFPLLSTHTTFAHLGEVLREVSSRIGGSLSFCNSRCPKAWTGVSARVAYLLQQAVVTPSSAHTHGTQLGAECTPSTSAEPASVPSSTCQKPECRPSPPPSSNLVSRCGTHQPYQSSSTPPAASQLLGSLVC